jgi:glycosyltransferase involved in cell wall biosynthesis
VGRDAYDVVIPCFNRELTVGNAVASVLAQDLAPARVILVDDGSSDGTAEVLRSLERRDPRISAVTLPRNVGASAARNAGLALAREEWVAFLDSDDIWLPGAAAAMLAAGDEADVVVGQFRRVWPCGTSGEPECAWAGGDILAALAVTGAIGPSWSIVRRSVAIKVAGFDPSFHNCNDWDFYVRLAAIGARFLRIDDVVAFYHVAEANRLSHDSSVGAANAARVQAHPVFDRLAVACEAG